MRPNKRKFNFYNITGIQPDSMPPKIEEIKQAITQLKNNQILREDNNSRLIMEIRYYVYIIFALTYNISYCMYRHNYIILCLILCLTEIFKVIWKTNSLRQ